MDDIDDIKKILAQELLLDIEEEKTQKIANYIVLLQKWNQKFNLTAIDKTREIVIKHIADSLSILPYLDHFDECADVGTGAGFPGVPLAIMHPEKTFFLIDSNGKKIRFLNHVKMQLEMNNITPQQQRLGGNTAVGHEKMFSTITSRAFAPLDKMTESLKDRCCAGGLLYAMKGKITAKELDQVGPSFTIERCVVLDVPNLQEERHLVVLKRTTFGDQSD